jgi:ATP-dependent Lhr-like helicase
MTENAFDLLHPKIAALAKARFGEPSEVQAAAIPLAMAGENVLAIAPTGSGKMEAAFLPVVSRLLESTEAGDKEGIRFLYITPLRALNRDMQHRMEYWAHLLGLSLGVRHGDTKQSERVKQKIKPPQIMVTTPESLSTILISPGIRDALRNVKWVVVDEIHELIDSKRGVQLSLALERLRERVKEKGPVQKTPRDFQIIGLSATVGDEAKAAEFLSPKTKVARADLKRKIELKVEFPTVVKDAEFAAKWRLEGEAAARVERLSQLIEESKSILVFVNTRSMAESLSALLFQVEILRGKVGVHHGSLARESRIATEAEFKREGTEGEKKLKAIVCTSSLELGIDVGRIDMVVQYHSPRQVTRLLQRVGRSGHRKNLVPKGIVLAVAGGDCVETAVLAHRALGGKLEAIRLPINCLDVLGAQVSGFVLDKCINPDDKLDTKSVYEIFKRSPYYRTLEFSEFIMVCKQLSQQRLLALSEDFASLAPARATKLYYYENLSTIRDLRRYFVKDAEKRRNVAVLDEEFVAEYLQKGVTFISRGVPWKVLSITDDEVIVEQAQDFTASIPDWVGEEIPVVFDATQEFAELLEKTGKGLLGKYELLRDYSCAGSAADQILAYAEKQRKYFLPQKGKFFLEESGKTLLLHTFAGNEANEALARAIAAMLSASRGESTRTRASAYSIAFEFSHPPDSKKFLKILAELDADSVEKILRNAIPHTAIFRSRFVDVAKRFGMIRRDADLKSINIKRLVEASTETPIWREALSEVLTEKMDIPRLRQIIKWPVEQVIRSDLSPLASEFVDLYASRELLAAVEPTAQLIDAFKKNLLGQRMKLVCNYCLNTFSIYLREAPEKISCPHCQSTQSTLAEYRKVLEKSAKGEKLEKGEGKLLEDARRVESQIGAYGGKALIALATYGVGPDSASRVLSRLRDDEAEFYRDLLEQQKQFIANRKYWKA